MPIFHVINTILLSLVVVLITVGYFKLQKELNKIMATQVEFDAQLKALNDEIDLMSADLTAFIASQPAAVDTSALQGVVDRLAALDTELKPPAPPA